MLILKLSEGCSYNKQIWFNDQFAIQFRLDLKKNVQILTSSGESLKLHHMYGVPESAFQAVSLRFYVLPSLSRGTFVIVVVRLRQFTCKSHSFQLEFVMKVRGGGFINAFDSPPLHLLSTTTSTRVTHAWSRAVSTREITSGP